MDAAQDNFSLLIMAQTNKKFGHPCTLGSACVERA